MNDRVAQEKMIKKGIPFKHLIVLIAVTIAFLIAPLLLRGYWIRLLTSVFMFGIMAESVNIIAGFTGYLALGNILFFGLGAYVTAVLMTKLGVMFYAAFFLSGLAGVFLSVLTGTVILRLRGKYFLMATFGLNELLKEITNNVKMTGGGMGITLPLFPGVPEKISYYFYYLMFIVMVVTILVTYSIAKSRVGYALRAIKADEDAAAVFGINTTFYKNLAWALSGFFTAITGSAFAYWMSYIDPGVVYDIVPSIKMSMMMVLGGAGTVMGPIIGAFFIELISELIWSKFTELHLLILGALLVFTVLFTPKGLMDFISQKKFSFSMFLSGIRENRI